MKPWTTQKFLLTFVLALSPYVLSPLARANEATDFTPRPDIITVAQQTSSEQPALRGQVEPPAPELLELFNAHVEAAAAFIALYPTQELYILGRDGETLYDTLRFLSRENPTQLARIKLINVSGANKHSPQLGSYLAQEGLSPERLLAEPQLGVVLIDTGFVGTVIEAIKRMFPLELRARVSLHLLSSSTDGIPSLRTFSSIYALGGKPLPSFIPSEMTYFISATEHLPRHARRSNRFGLINGRYEALPSPAAQIPSTIEDGVFSPGESLQLQRSLVVYLQQPAVLQLFNARVALWTRLTRIVREYAALPSRHLRSLGVIQGIFRHRLNQALKEHGVQAASHVRENILHDLVDWSLNHVKSELNLGPKFLRTEVAPLFYFKNSANIAALHPRATETLLTNRTAIADALSSLHSPSLIIEVTKRLAYLTELRFLGEYLGPHFAEQLAEHLDGPQAQELTEIIRNLIQSIHFKNNEHPLSIQNFSHSFFLHPNSAQYPELLRLAFDRMNLRELDFFDRVVLKAPHWRKHPEIQSFQRIASTSPCTPLLTQP